MAQNSKDAQKRTSRAERRAAEAAAMKARAEQMEKERKQQTIIGGIVVAGDSGGDRRVHRVPQHA